MATDLEKLVVQLSADFRQFQRETARASGLANREFRAIENRARQMNRNLDMIGRNAARSLAAPFAGLSAVLGGRELVRMTGVWTDLNSRIVNAVGSADRASMVMDRLSAVARRTYSSIEQTTEGFLNFSTTLSDLGYRTGQQLDFVESLNNALVVSGARGDVATRVMEALSRAMALGTLQGQNLNTVIASGGRVAQALADSMGVSTLELRRLGQEGRIGRREIMGITSQLSRLRDEAAAMPGTIQDGFLLLNNALLEYIGRGDEAAGISARIAEALTLIADNFDTVGDVTLQVAAVIAGALVGRALTGMIRTAGQGTVALMGLARALASVRTAGGALAAFGGLGAAAGPAAIVIGGALVASLIAFSGRSDDASRSVEALRDRFEALGIESGSAAGNVEGAAQRIRRAVESMSARELREYEGEVRGVNRAVQDLQREIMGLLQVASFDGVALGFSDEEIDRLIDMNEGFQDGRVSAQELEDAINSLARANPNFGRLADALNPLISRLSEALGLVHNLGAVVFSPEAGLRRREMDADDAAAERSRAAFIAEQARLASRTREQIALERELEAVQTAAREAGVRLTRQQAEERARANLALREAANPSRSGGGGGRGDRTAYTNEVRQFREAIAALEAEAAAINGVELSLQGYADAAAYVQRRLELMQAAQRQGLEITPQLQAEIDALARSYIDAGNAVEHARERHEQFRSAVEDARSTMEQAFTGLITGAHSFSDALRSVLSRLAEMAANRAFQLLWEGGGGTKGIGSGVGGFIKRLLDFDRGGYTGAGGRLEPAGVVHKGEVVWSQDDVRRVGGPAMAEAIRKGGGKMPGYASGGVVGGVSLPALPSFRAGSSGPERLELVVHAAEGVTVEQAGEISEAVSLRVVRSSNKALRKELPKAVRNVNSRPRWTY